MDLAGTLQSFVVIFLIVTVTSRFLNRVDLMVIFTRALAFVIIAIIGPPITIISTVTIVVVAPIVMVAVVVLTMVIGFHVLARWVFVA
jgi:hypothetical protein